MDQLLALVNIRVLTALFISALILLSLASTAAALTQDIVDSHAFHAASMSEQDSIILEHKLYLQENSSPVDDGLDAVAYERSQKAKEVANANAKLAQLKASIGGAE